MIKKKPKLNREELNEKSKQLKRQRKHKGLPSGSRFNANEGNKSTSQKMVADPRIGSKKTIPLIVKSPVEKPKNSPAIKIISLEDELKQLENDPYLETLLDLTESDKPLTDKQQDDLDKMLDRIDILMKQLGYDDEIDDFDDEDSETKENIMSLLKI